MDSASLPHKDIEALKGKTKDELIEIVLKLQRKPHVLSEKDYVYVDAVARQGSHVGLPTFRPGPGVRIRP